MKLSLLITSVFLISVECTLAQSTDTLKIKSKVMNDDLEIWISKPNGYDTSSNLPLLLCLDADAMFQFLPSLVHYLSRPFDKTIPPALIVGIRSKSQLWRRKYFYPHSMSDSTSKIENDRADDLCEFIRLDLLPTLLTKYKIGKQKILIGHSNAGLFAFYSLYKHPDLFDAIVSISPTPRNGLIANTYLQYILSKEYLSDKRIYFSVAGNDLPNYFIGSQEIKNVLDTFSNNKIKWIYEFHPQYNHWTTLLPSVYNALVWLFKK